MRLRSYLPAAIGVTLSLHAAAFFLLEVSPREREELHANAPRGIDWLGDRDATIESIFGMQLALYDPTPLFLPTEHNVAYEPDLDERYRRPGEMFPLYVERLKVPEQGGPPGLVVLPARAITPLAAMREFDWPFLATLGQVDVRNPARVAQRAALLEVRSVRGDLVLRHEVTLAAAPEAGSWQPWRPFEMEVAVHPSGSLGPPLVHAPGSDAAAVDEFFRTYVRSMLRLDLRLAPGSYQVTVGP